MKLSVRILGLILGIFSVCSLFTPQAYATSHLVGSAEGGTTTNPYWMQSVEDVKKIFTKSPTAYEALNKEFGDIGAGINQQIGFIMSAVGACDYACDANCPKAVSYQHSTMAGLQNIAVATYSNPPASTYAFVEDIGSTLGFIPDKAHAQGVGFSGLKVMLPLWKAFRNIAYALLAVVLIIVGFMVMFRKKIDPKTVVTVQNAIPRIVIALLLVTFSYAIVGIFIDLMYLVIILTVSVAGTASDNLGSAVSKAASWCLGLPTDISQIDLNPFVQTTPALTTPEVTSVLLSGGVGRLLGFFFGSGFQAFNDIGNMMTGGNTLVQQATTYLPPLFGFLVSGGSVKGAIGGGLLSGPVLLAAILVIVLIFGFIRLVFMLLDAYINIIISLLTAPFQLMMEAIPGTNAFGSWSRNLISKLLTFPITVIMLVIAAILTSSESKDAMWAPPLLASGNGSYGMAGFIGLGFLLVIPNVVGSIQKAMKAEALIPGGVGAVVGPLGQGVGQLTQLLYQGSFISSAFRHKPDARTPVQVAREGAQKGFSSLTGGGEGH